MENNFFVVTVNNTDYKVKMSSVIPPLYDVFCGEAYHQIGKTDAGLWVYVETPSCVQHMPLQEIGEAIDIHFSLDSEEVN
ncbi:hypothetical protein FO440_18870 [Mucilaginibacter corticis]|uniref:Uncharacterized protein n=1 Tax=Mucilaginibacter corticis TaxID=2597670 RepID=A0A556MFE1_9SPHI|nr:hypothetical protein [Mucilaginibacter corticis]TSJ38579.1 hypothetical protein FO440_18870 [Mucilaginibacter corticis]